MRTILISLALLCLTARTPRRYTYTFEVRALSDSGRSVTVERREVQANEKLGDWRSSVNRLMELRGIEKGGAR